MVREDRVVVGSYRNRDDAVSVINRLKEDGYRKEDITLYTNSENIDGLRDSQDIDVQADSAERSTEETEDNRSFWDQVKDAFSTESYNYEETAQDPAYNQEDDILYPYRDDINSGHTVIVVDNYRGDTDLDAGPTTAAGRSGVNRTETSVNEKTNISDNNLTDDEKIRLKEERLEVDKEERKTGEVNVRKETKHDTKSVDVPVEREEVVIERKPVTGEDSETTDSDIDEDSESYTIPVKEEKVEVDKKPVVKEEVEVKKERHEDVEEVTEDVKREELDVDSEGRTGAEAEDTDRDLDRKNRRNDR
jgi:uncharacterized protein (TIGR02271 family)